MNLRHRIAVASVLAGAITGLLIVAHQQPDTPTETTTSSCTVAPYIRSKFGNEPTTATRTATIALYSNVDGSVLDPYTGIIHQSASGMDADHVVPLQVAWERGARCWSPAQRHAYASDVHYLRLTAASINRSKGAKSLDEWQPAVNQCEYAQLYHEALTFWRLSISPAEDIAYTQACETA